MPRLEHRRRPARNGGHERHERHERHEHGAPDSRANADVLILTGRGHTVDRGLGLELGCDDYVVKPCPQHHSVAPGAPGSSGGGQRPYANFLGWPLDCVACMLRAADGGAQLLGTAQMQRPGPGRAQSARIRGGA